MFQTTFYVSRGCRGNKSKRHRLSSREFVYQKQPPIRHPLRLATSYSSSPAARNLLFIIPCDSQAPIHHPLRLASSYSSSPAARNLLFIIPCGSQPPIHHPLRLATSYSSSPAARPHFLHFCSHYSPTFQVAPGCLFCFRSNKQTSICVFDETI